MVRSTTGRRRGRQLSDAAARGALALEVAARPGRSRVEVRQLEVLSDPVPAPVPGYPIGWCIRAKGTAPDEAKAAGFEYVELALQDVLDLPDAEMQQAAERFRAGHPGADRLQPHPGRAEAGGAGGRQRTSRTSTCRARCRGWRSWG